MFTGLGVSRGTPDDDKALNITKLRYHKIIIMTDADVDGAHIRTLLLTLFYRHFPDLITQGHIYIAQPPLYSVTKGKEKQWAYDEKDKDRIIKEIIAKKSKKTDEELIEETQFESPEGTAISGNSNEGNSLKAAGISLSRFKGLGEMNAEQLWDTTMNPANRILLQVTMDNAEKADEVFTLLMGDDVPPRKRFIQTRAKMVTNLDIQ